MRNTLYYGDNLDVLRDFPPEFVDLVYLDPPFNSSRSYNVLFKDESGQRYTPTTTFETYPFPWPPGQEPQDDPRVQAVAAAAEALVELRDARLNPPGLDEKQLQGRTLTNLYNERPDWLDAAHKKLDAAVFDAYGWQHDLTDEEILTRLLALNLERVES